MSAFDGAGPDPQDSFSLSPAKFPGLPQLSGCQAPSVSWLHPQQEMGLTIILPESGDFSICICTDPTHASVKPQAVFSSDSVSTYYKPRSVLSTEGTRHRERPMQTLVSHVAIFAVVDSQL